MAHYETYDLFITDMTEEVDHLTAEVIDEWMATIEYQGFDPAQTFVELQKKEPNKKVFISDMRKICAFYAAGGTNYARDAKKYVSAEAKTTVTALMQKYGIKVNLNGLPGSPSVITLGRVALTFPELVAASYNSGISNTIIVKEGLPPAFTFPGGCTIMSDEEWLRYKDVYIEAMCDFASIVSRYKGKDDPGSTKEVRREDLKARQEGYANTARAGNFVKASLTKRRGLLTKTTAAYMKGKKARKISPFVT